MLLRLTSLTACDWMRATSRIFICWSSVLLVCMCVSKECVLCTLFWTGCADSAALCGILRRMFMVVESSHLLTGVLLQWCPKIELSLASMMICFLAVVFALCPVSIFLHYISCTDADMLSIITHLPPSQGCSSYLSSPFLSPQPEAFKGRNSSDECCLNTA